MQKFTVYILFLPPILFARGFPRKRSNMEKFIIGLAVGMAAGAVIVANNCKLRNLVKKNQDDLMQKAEEYIDVKLEQLESKSAKKSQQKTAGGEQ